MCSLDTSPCPCPHGASHCVWGELAADRGCKAGILSLLLQLQGQGKHGGVEGGEPKALQLPPHECWAWQKLILILHYNSAWYWLQTDISPSSQLFFPVQLCWTAQILQDPTLWCLLYLFFSKPLSDLEDRYHYEPEQPEVRKSIFWRIPELRIKVFPHYFRGHGNQTLLKKTKSGFLLNFCSALVFGPSTKDESWTPPGARSSWQHYSRWSQQTLALACLCRNWSFLERTSEFNPA